jgi:hypothetical protein
MLTVLKILSLALSLSLLVPALAAAQTLAGVVRDTSGAILPGVTVEAASINAEMRVGALDESITVRGEAPVVDVQSARQTTVINGDVVRALPASGSYGTYLAAVPAI